MVGRLTDGGDGKLVQIYPMLWELAVSLLEIRPVGTVWHANKKRWRILEDRNIS